MCSHNDSKCWPKHEGLSTDNWAIADMYEYSRAVAGCSKSIAVETGKRFFFAKHMLSGDSINEYGK